MELYIVRHGDAIDRDDPSVTSDEMRELTRAGRDEIDVAARVLGRLGVRPGLVLASPLVRAMQTGEIFAEALSVASGVTVSAELAPGGSLMGIINDVLTNGRPDQAVLCGHMPGVGQLVGYLAWGELDMVVPFRTGQVCRIDLPDDALRPGSGDLRWMLPPRISRRLLEPA